jgi:hypothetical protein
MIPVVGSYPPTMSTWPLLNNVAVCPTRAVFRVLGKSVNVPATGSKISAEFRVVKPDTLEPPAISTVPSFKRVAVCSQRATFIGLPAAKVWLAAV